MPGLEVMDLYQRATLWPVSGPSAYGQPTLGTPVEIPCRWNWKRSTRRQPDGSTITLDAQVVVDQDVACESQMWLGTLANWNATGSAYPDSELMIVFEFNRQLDEKGRFSRRTVSLMRKHSAPGAG